MASSSAAEKVAQHSGEKEKEKAEKRRALGRGLESLLPGPRIVVGTSEPAVAESVANADVASNVSTAAVGIDPEKSRAGAPGPGVAELRSAGQPGAAVPTTPVPASAIPTSTIPASAGLASAVSSSAVPTAAIPAAAGATSETFSIYAQAEGRTPGNLVSNIRLDHIDKNPYQTRYLFDQELLEELADSIRVNGVVQPVVVRPSEEEEGRYVLILGERRCRASKMAGKESVPAIVRRVSQQQAAEMTVVENLQRQDLNCLEQAEAFRLLSKEFNLTQEEIGERVGMSRESVSNYMRLLRLPAEVMEYLAHGQIGFSEAREMLSLDDASKIPALAEEIVKKHMSVEQIEMMVSRMNGWLDPVPGMPGQEKKRTGSRWQDPNVRAAQLELERTLGLRVRIRDKKGKGKILIEYSNVDDYERVVGMLRRK